jgi:PAS domain S-box-containing protein
VNQSGKIHLVNAQTEKLFGYTRAELIGAAVEVLVPQRFHGEYSGHREAYAQSPRPRSMGAGLDLCGRRKDGTEFPVEISLSPLETAEGTLISSAIRDITKPKHAESVFRGLLRSAPDSVVRCVCIATRGTRRGSESVSRTRAGQYDRGVEAKEGEDY